MLNKISRKTKDFIRKNSSSFQRNKIRAILMPYFVHYRLKRWSGLPDIVLIENTNHCNAECVMCPNPFMKRKKGVMSGDLYRKIIDECIKLGIKSVQITGTGEPLIDPSVFEKIAYAKKAGMKRVRMFTNAALLDSKRQDQLLSSEIDVVIISIDSFSPETYDSIRVGLSFQTIKSNVLSLLKKKHEKAIKKPFIYITGLTLNKTKQSERDSLFYQNIVNLSDGVSIVEYEGIHDWSGSMQNIDATPCHWHNLPCRRLWGTLSILWDGTINLCCIDFEGSIKLGSCTDESLKEVWSGKKIKMLREFHLKSQFNKIELCRKCYERPSWIQNVF